MRVCRLPTTLVAWVVVSASCLMSGCSSLPGRVTQQQSDPIQFAGVEQGASKTVYVVGHGWHTGLVLRTSDIPPEVVPEIRDFEDTHFVELGWGDEGFYRAKSITVPLVLRAAFWPTPSVLHVAGFRGSVKNFYQVSDIVEVNLSDDQFDNMCQFVANTFAKTETGESIPLGPGIYGESTFYRAKEKYYVPKTCNTWTAKALKHAGFPIIPQFAVTADNVISRSRRFGHVLQESPSGLKQAALLGGK